MNHLILLTLELARYFPQCTATGLQKKFLVKTFLSKVLLHFSKRSSGIKAPLFPLHLCPLIFPPHCQGRLRSLLSPIDAVQDSGCCSWSGSVQVPMCQAAAAKCNAKCKQCRTKHYSCLSLSGQTTSSPHLPTELHDLMES